MRKCLVANCHKLLLALHGSFHQLRQSGIDEGRHLRALMREADGRIAVQMALPSGTYLEFTGTRGGSIVISNHKDFSNLILIWHCYCCEN